MSNPSLFPPTPDERGGKINAGFVLAIDAGTSGVRCLITDLEGNLTSLARHEWRYQTPDDTAPLGKEFHPASFWRIICQTMGQALKDSRIHAGDIIAVSATSQREGAVFLDRAGHELYAGPNIDLRALAEGMSIDSQFGREIYSITGHTPSFLFVPAKLRWFQTNRAELYDKIAAVLTISDWIIYKLCGERVSEAAGVSELGLADIHRRQWSKRLPDLLGLPEDIYPELVPAGKAVGRVTRQSASDTGIPEGTPVAQGAPDAQCGLIGMGIKNKGEAGIVLGWSAPVQMVIDKPIIDAKARTWTSCHPLPERWILESSTGDAGNAYDWVKETIFDESSKEPVYAIMDRMASEVPPGAEGVLAFIGPSAMDMNQLGLKLGGFLFPAPTVAIRVGKAHLVRASLENLGFAIKANCRQLERVSSIKVKDLVIGGGLSRSQSLTRILPAVLNMPVGVSTIAEVSGLGAAICAAVGAGVYPSLEAAMKAMVAPPRVVEPDPVSALEYAEYYQRWARAARWLEKLGKEIK